MKVFKIKKAYLGAKYFGSKVIDLNDDTSQRDLNFIFKETGGNYEGIFEVPQPEKPKEKKTKKED